MVLTEKNVRAEEAEKLGVVDKVMVDPLKEPIKIAKPIAGNSPDVLEVSRGGIFLGLGEVDSFEAEKLFIHRYWEGLKAAPNSERNNAFVERRKPAWVKRKS